ncbi:MAG: cell division protein ZapA [Verrucomicrobia bacterium]|nr:cell division protein ZapA [Cytophagales bacterium]
MTDQEVSIKIKIAERDYPVKITAKNEEIFRKAGKIINDKLTEYKKKYGSNVKDNQDLLAMVALFSMIEKLSTEDEKQDFEKHITDKVTHINRLMADAVLFNL